MTRKVAIPRALPHRVAGAILLLVSDFSISFVPPTNRSGSSRPPRDVLRASGIDGTIVLVGGQVADSVFQRFVELAGGEKANLVVITTAREDADKEDDDKHMEAWKSRRPASVVRLHAPSPQTADEAAFVAPLRQAAVSGWMTATRLDSQKELFRRYANGLIALARSRLSPKLARRLDPEDVVHSAYRSFFAAVREGRYEIQRGGDLWQLLVTITLHKVQHQVRLQTAGKRAVQREQHFGSEDSLLGMHAALLAREPSPMAALVLAEQLEQLMGLLNPLQRRMLELRLQGHNLKEIAAATQRSQAMVRRALDRVKEQLKLWHHGNASA
jgi:RNA polymerase sigma-70 factor, ECF subfamily